MSIAPAGCRRLFLPLLWKSLPVLTALVLGWSLGLHPAPAYAKDNAPAKKPEKASDEDEIPPPEDVDLSTDDGLEMKATFYPGTKGQESIPVILIHGLGPKNSRKDFTQDQGLAAFLQEKFGCAVIVPDLRGHGESTKIKVGKRTETLKPEKLQPVQHLNMVQQDLRAVKDYLWKKNNDKALNLDKLTVIGVEGGATIALNYAAYDAKGYENGAAKYGPLKLGNFVRALVLISPQTKLTGLKTAQILRDSEFCSTVPVMILAGNQNKEYFNDADRLHNVFLNGRPKLEAPKPEDITVWFYSKIETKLQGNKLLDETSLNIPDKIKAFMTSRLVKNPDAKDYTWRQLKLPHE